jgi:hypothetical protein
MTVSLAALPVEGERKNDFRSLCGLADCAERAMSLFAWPGRNPVPLCRTHREMVQAAVASMKAKRSEAYTEKDWLDWLEQYGKPHIVRGR